MTKHKENEKDTNVNKEEVITLTITEHEGLKESAKIAEEFKNKYLMAHADLDNARKRMAKEKEDYVKFANEKFLSEILYVVDNFDRALDHMNGTQKVDTILQGIKMIQKQFHLLLEQKGVIKIEALGKKFDPAFHEAIEHIESGEEEDGIIIEEVQTGYLFNNRLLRPSVVKIGKKK
ncbi:MAG: nucleotide exchange factor GrpE [Candidatus Omnitrophica bacterium]|nr:nucleotide exchange factor GrpE [Candidatus Omnitrophota bacterium]